jgi:Caspase domain
MMRYLYRALILLACSSAVLAQNAQHRGIWLEAPGLKTEVSAEENGTVLLPKEGVQFVRLHINRKPGQVTYGSITTKVNAEAANVATTQRSTEEGVVCDIDLARNATIAVHPGLNSVEVAFKDRWNQTHYASFLLQIPKNRQTAKLNFRPPVAAGGTKYALIVGISRYQSAGSGLSNLRYAATDAATFRDFVLSPRGGSFPPTNVEFLQDESATLSNILGGVSRILAHATPNDTIVVYVNSHGTTDPGSALDRRGNNFLLTYDTDPANVTGTALPISEVEDLLVNELKSKHVIVFADTSHGSSIGEKTNNLVNDYWIRLGSHAGLAVLTANDKGQLSREGDEWGGHGVFTSYLLKGLTGEADQDGDGTVTVAELFSYVRKKVNLDTEYAQDPMVAPDTLIPMPAPPTPRGGVGEAAAESEDPIGTLPLSGMMASPATAAKPAAHGR